MMSQTVTTTVIETNNVDNGMTEELFEISRLHGEDSTRLAKIEELRELILAKEIKNIQGTDVQFLIAFLRAQDFDVKKAFLSYTEYHRILNEIPVVLNPRLAFDLQHAFESQVLHPLPYPDKNGNLIYLQKLGNWDTTAVKVEDLSYAGWVCMHHSYLQPRAQVIGVISLVDLKGVGLNHLKAMAYDTVKRTIAVFEKGFPMKYRAVHYINNNFFFQMAYNMFKHLMSKELREKFQLHGTNYMKSLHEAIGKDSLPEEYGGTRPNPDAMEYYNKMLQIQFPKEFNNNQ